MAFSSIRGVSRTVVALCSLIVAYQSDLVTSDAPKSQVLTCLEKAAIQMSTPLAETWSVDTEAWNSRVSPVPAVVVFPKTEEQVSAALKCAAAADVKVTTLGGNRSFSSLGFGRNNNALIMNLKYLKHLIYDEKTQLLSYGGPVTIADAVKYMWTKCERTVNHGRCPNVGMAGVAASGFGTLSRAGGTVLDSIVSVRAALANGTIVNADAKTNSDLFWGCRGAASSLAVILDFKIKTFKPPSMLVTNYTIAFDSKYKPTEQDNVDALIGTQTWALSKDNNDYLSIRFSLKTKSDLKGFFYGPSDKAAQVLGSLMKYLPSSMVLKTTENDFWTSEEISTPGLVTQKPDDRRYFYIVSVTIPRKTPLTNATAWELFTNTAFLPKDPIASTSGFIDIWAGLYTKSVKPDDSAWKHDDNLLLIRWDMRTESFDVPFPESSITTMRNNFYKFVNAYKASGGEPGGFPTYRDDRLTVAEMAKFLYGGGNFKKLQQIKTKYDPTELFNTDPQSIPALKA
ncbi:berberine-like protein [Plasmopara halstedii]|uniref:Berberine-like protein n=1 Tax=Plasmopara halstedii TaxID=4781 RepID=A0A0P1AZF8_PLAHL|nr:berberine-like protein [Plasmopara halstedii]CEG47841.1 berberine-like protein [Plasmopara halstedii]|eukprot:XP_024584210.1 berberine-like protein [Plasmopara halstedii]